MLFSEHLKKEGYESQYHLTGGLQIGMHTGAQVGGAQVTGAQ
jgi:hypothetical protein